MDWASGLISGVGALFGGSSASKDRKMQKQFAQNQIQWRVADAKAAGVHPLYALGASVTPYTSVGDGGVGASLSALGQDISRAKLAQMDMRERRAEMLAANMRADREFAMKQEQHAVDLETGRLQNQLLASQIARQPGQVPPAAPTLSPSIGPNRGPHVRVVPSEVRASAPGDAARQAGVITDYQYVRTGTGVGIVPSEDIAQRFDEIPGQGIGWWYRRSFQPFFGQNIPRTPPTGDFPLPPGYRWVWNGTEFRARRVRSDGTVDFTGWLPHR